MPSAAQIKANRQNSKHSTGPVTAAGAEVSSRNALKHGLTSQTIVITPEERDAYEAHVREYMDHHQPVNYRHRELVQQKADANWSIHQIFVQQTMTLSLMTAITVQMSAAGDPSATAAAIVPVARTLATLSTYESRRRRALKAIEAELNALEEQVAAIRAAQATSMYKETNGEPEVGFVHPETGAPITTADYESILAKADALIRQFQAEENAEFAA